MLLPSALCVLASLAAGGIPHAPGERMEFTIDYLAMRVGKARIEVGEPADSALPVFLDARTAGVMRMLTFRQRLATHLDLDTGLPRVATLDTQEPGYARFDRTEFDRATNRAKVRRIGKSDTTDEVEVPPAALDFVALVFRLRTLPLADGQEHGFDVLAGRKVNRVVATVVGREQVKTDAGRFPAVKVKVPTGFSGKFQEKSPTYVWFSDDERRIIVKIVTEFGIGRATADLVRYTPPTPGAAGG
jgi:hypothetical protein